MPDIMLSNRGMGTHKGNILIHLRTAIHEIGLDRSGNVEFVSVYNRDGGHVTVYRNKLVPSRFKKWVISGAVDYDDLVFVRISQEELQAKMKEVLYAFIMDDMDEKVLGDNDRGMENFV